MVLDRPLPFTESLLNVNFPLVKSITHVFCFRKRSHRRFGRSVTDFCRGELEGNDIVSFGQVTTKRREAGCPWDKVLRKNLRAACLRPFSRSEDL